MSFLSVFSQLPCLGHHDAEVLVCVDRGGYVAIVVAELVKGDDAVGHLGVPHAHKLAVGLLWRLLTVDDVGVLADIVDSSDIVEGHLAVAIDIKFLVSLPDETPSVIIKIASQGHQELIKVDRA